MSIPIQKDAEEALTCIHRQLVEIILGAWEDWRSEKSIFFFPRTRANIVWEHIVRRAKACWENDPKMRIVEGGNTCLFILEDKICFRFKKADTAGLSRNVLTCPGLPLPYHNHDLPLFDVPEMPRIEVVYVLSNHQDRVAHLLVVARNQDSIVWHYELPLDAETQPIQLPPIQTPLAEKFLVTLKALPTKQQESRGE